MALLAIHRPLVAFACALVTGLAPVASRADDAARISFLESEIQKLRTQIGDQDRRIQRLEAELASRGTAGMPSRPVERAAASAASGASKPLSGPQPWHALEAWDRVAKGMTQDEVTKILGEPTTVQSVDNYKTLFYSGIAAGGHSLNGLVNLRDERVVAVKKPN